MPVFQLSFSDFLKEGQIEMTLIKVFPLVLLCVFIARNVDGHPVDEDHLNIVITKGDTKVEIDLEDDLSDKDQLGATPENPAESCDQIAACSKSGYYWLKGETDLVGVYCEMKPKFNEKGGWMRVANVNLTEPDSECPDGLELFTNTKRMCRKPSSNGGCGSTTIDTHGIEYKKVCGKIIGYQYYSTDAFNPYYGNRALTISDNYVEGVSITHGNNPRHHIWTFASALHEDGRQNNLRHTCPCSNTGVTFDWAIPPFVGSDYYCETANRDFFANHPSEWLLNDPLWDGQGCGPQSSCCDGAGKPWFCKELSQPTTDDIELRVCTNQPRSNEDVAVEIIELYIK